jgi:hypothetical protein
VVPVSVSYIPGKTDYHWRVWRSPQGNVATATAYETPAAQADVYTLAVDADLPRRAAQVTVTLSSGTFAPGERIFLTREQIDPSATADGHSRFAPNNRDKPVRMEPPVFSNALIAIEGDWGAFHLDVDGGPPEDPAAWRAARFAPITPLFQPQPGSPAIGLGTDPSRTARDLTGRRRPAVPTIGALEPSSDLSAWEPFPREPRGIRVDWLPDTLAVNGATDTNALNVSIEDPGYPALRRDDVKVSFAWKPKRDQRQGVDHDLHAVVDWTHLATGRRMIEVPMGTRRE